MAETENTEIRGGGHGANRLGRRRLKRDNDRQQKLAMASQDLGTGSQGPAATAVGQGGLQAVGRSDRLWEAQRELINSENSVTK